MYYMFLKHFTIKILSDIKKNPSSEIVTIFPKYPVFWNIELSSCKGGINFGFTDEKNIKCILNDFLN